MFWNNTVDSVVASLNKTVAKLERLAVKKDAEVMRNANKIAVLSDKCDCCRNEAARASRIAEKISSLVK